MSTNWQRLQKDRSILKDHYHQHWKHLRPEMALSPALIQLFQEPEQDPWQHHFQLWRNSLVNTIQ